MAEVETISHIHRDHNSVAWVDDTNIKVVEVVSSKLAYDLTPEELHEQYPHLSLGQVYAALAYYYDHKDEMDQDIAQRAKVADELRVQTEDASLRARLHETRKSWKP